jgi:drug/metabolite transporter (DMT)-like permease
VAVQSGPQPLRAAPSAFALLDSRPVEAALAGAVAIAFSGILFRLADVSASTGAFFRCLYALPPLWLLARLEDRRYGPRPARARGLALGAGVFFAVDLVLWHNAVEAVGAGLATVLGNTQVLLVGLLAWALLDERPSGRALASIPIAFSGVVLISGVFEEGAYGSDPTMGVVYGVLTGMAYAGFLLTLRQGSLDLRRLAGPLFDATAASAVVTALIGVALGELDPLPAWESQLWLVVLALSSQFLGWLLIAVSLPRLPAVLTSVLLMMQPLLAVIFAALLVDERPSAIQLAGAGAILAGVVLASSTRRGAAPVSAPVPGVADA